jgi:hypothetical protein
MRQRAQLSAHAPEDVQEPITTEWPLKQARSMMTETIRDAMRVISGEDDREFATEDGIITP